MNEKKVKLFRGIARETGFTEKWMQKKIRKYAQKIGIKGAYDFIELCLRTQSQLREIKESRDASKGN